MGIVEDKMKAQKYDELMNQHKTQTAFEDGQKVVLEKLKARNAEIARQAALNAAIAYNNKGLTDYGRDILNGRAPSWNPSEGTAPTNYTEPIGSGELTQYGRDIRDGKAPQDWFPGIKK